MAVTINAHSPQQQDKVDFFDTVWDILNVLYDGGKIVYGYATSNPIMIANGWTDLGIDVTAAFIPGAPAGSSKLARIAVKEGSKTVGKSCTKSSARGFISHVLARHGAKSTAHGASKFYVSTADEMAKLLVKVKSRIKNGYASLDFRAPNSTYRYVVDMGEEIGTYYAKSKHRPTKYIEVILNPGSRDFGTMIPVKKYRTASFESLLK